MANAVLTRSTTHARKAVALMRQAGACDEIETRALLNLSAAIHLSAARSARAVQQ